MMEGRGGVALNDLIVKTGRRSSIFRSYIFPKLGQPNLTVLTNAQVSRLLFNATTVVGVEVMQGASSKRLMADREVRRAAEIIKKAHGI